MACLRPQICLFHFCPELKRRFVRPTAMNEEKRVSDQAIACYASVLNAAHLLAEESALRLQQLAARYPDAFPPEILPQELAITFDEWAHQMEADTPQGLPEQVPAAEPAS
jgi:hypothetical protein